MGYTPPTPEEQIANMVEDFWEERTTLRDRFAMAALQGMLLVVVGEEPASWQRFEDAATSAYYYADAMLKAREE